MYRQTRPEEREAFHQRYQQGESYQEIADSTHWSKGCIRYWCRRQRDGGSCKTVIHRTVKGILICFQPLVRYVILRLRLKHPRWGPNRIRAKLTQRPSLRHRTLPSDASIGRYLHQWACFRRHSKPKPPMRERPQQPTAVHQRWQIDFKIGIPLNNGMLVNLHTVRDPVGEACLGAFVFAAGKVGRPAQSVTPEQVRSVLRLCFARWHTLPQQVQTDGESVLIGRQDDPCPTLFTLWLIGLGIAHLVIRPGTPTDNAEVERCHRTVMDYAVTGSEDCAIAQLQEILDQAVYELAFELSSRAPGCRGRPPVIAHPELLCPPRPFQAQEELVNFRLGCVDAYLTRLTLKRKIDNTGRITIGGRHERYVVGRGYANQHVHVRFDPADRDFVFYVADEPGPEIGRQPARGLEVSNITGLEVWPMGLGTQQLRLPLFEFKG